MISKYEWMMSTYRRDITKIITPQTEHRIWSILVVNHIWTPYWVHRKNVLQGVTVLDDFRIVIVLKLLVIYTIDKWFAIVHVSGAKCEQEYFIEKGKHVTGYDYMMTTDVCSKICLIQGVLLYHYLHYFTDIVFDETKFNHFYGKYVTHYVQKIARLREQDTNTWGRWDRCKKQMHASTKFDHSKKHYNLKKTENDDALSLIGMNGAC